VSFKKPLGSSNLRLFQGLGLGAVATALAVFAVARPGTPARADDAAAPRAVAASGDAKPFTEKIPGTDASFEMVPIPGGTFTMGSPENEKKRKPDEGPQFQVKVEPFFMGAREVTWGEYGEFLRNYQKLANQKGTPAAIPADKMADAVTYPTPMYELEAGPILKRMGRTAKHPAVIMSVYAARQYTKWLSKKTGRFYRLPSEAEWEFAARAGTKTAYFFGDDPKKLGDYAWYFDNSALSDGDAGYHPVGEKKPNPWGLYDIYGNVAEYVIDQYDENWYKQFAGKTVAAHDTINWAKTQYPRIARGGGYESDPEACRSAARSKITVAQNDKDPQLPKSPHWMSNGFWLGFRVVSPVKEPDEAEKHKWWDIDDPQTRQIVEKDRAERQMHELITPPAK
jgi:formylglycine-generating enzyme required for sulfatase activity